MNFPCSLSNILGFLALYVPYVYLPSMITAKGISMEKASFIVSAIGMISFRLYKRDYLTFYL